MKRASSILWLVLFGVWMAMCVDTCRGGGQQIQQRIDRHWR